MKRAPGDSGEQTKAEKRLLALLGDELSVTLAQKDFPLPKGGKLQVDGACESPRILCEAWAHQGPPKGSQPKKVMTDAFKLLYAAQLNSGPTQKILLFGDSRAARPFRGKSWMAHALETYGIEMHVVKLPKATRAAVRKAQKRQYRWKKPL